MEAGVPLMPSQDRPPPLPSLASGRLQARGDDAAARCEAGG